MIPTRTPSTPLGSIILFLTLSLILTAGTGAGCNDKKKPPVPVIGDANGSGYFDVQDAIYVRDRLAEGGAPAQPAYLSDVALPCSGYVDFDDYAMLRAAAEAQAQGEPYSSRCHPGQRIGEAANFPIPDPEDMLPPRPPTIDDQFSAVADIVPEFGGAWVGPNGDVQVVLTDPSQDVLGMAVESMYNVFGAEALPHDVFVAVQGRYGFRDLQTVRSLLRPYLAAPGFVELDVDEKENRVRVGIEAAHAYLQNKVEKDVGQAGFLLDMLIVETVEAPVDEGAWGGEEVRKDNGNGTHGLCTLGFVAKHADELGFVTNAHCGHVMGTPDTTYMDAGQTEIGTETAEAAVVTSAEDPMCPSGAQCMHADVTFVKLNPGVTGQRGRITRHSGPGHYTIVQEALFGWVGQDVVKVGRTTLETSGEIFATCVDVTSSSGITKLCSDKADYDSDGGDSGSPVFRILSGTDVALHGVHWGSVANQPNASFSPMHQIHYEIAPLWSLNFAWDNEPPNVLLFDPDDGDAVVGSLVPTAHKAFFWDFEDGYGCPTCLVHWASSTAGALGTTPATGPWVQDNFLLSGGSTQKITATAVDSDGDLTHAAVWLAGDSVAPGVTILEPQPYAELWQGATYRYEGTSFDADLFGPLPCNDLRWELPPNGSITTGCSAANSVNQLGNHSVTLKATDPGTSNEVTDTHYVTVVPPPANAPPHVVITQPGSGMGFEVDWVVSLRGRVQDFDDAGPVTYEWVVKWQSSEIVLGSGSMSNHSYTDISWDVSDHFFVAPGTPADAGKQALSCGGDNVLIELRGTTADQETESDAVSVYLPGPVC